jgi:hypothetical protein
MKRRKFHFLQKLFFGNNKKFLVFILIISLLIGTRFLGNEVGNYYKIYQRRKFLAKLS